MVEPRSFGSTVFLGDWFRWLPGQTGRWQTGNVTWLSRLLSQALGIRPGDLRVVMPSLDAATFAAELGNEELAQRYRDDPLATWAELYRGVLPEGTFRTLFDQIRPDDLVIGFEIPPVIRSALDERGMAYASFHNHPIRFLKDLAFGVYSNIPQICASFEAIACNPIEVERQAARLSARFARLDPAQSRLPEGCPILFGQTEHDASLIVDGRFARWADHADALAEALKGHDAVAFVRHPHAAWQRDTIELLRSRLGKTVIGVSGNSYPLIMSGRPHGPVLTLSSSIGVEAEVFGYETRFLLADPRAKFADKSCETRMQIMVDHRLFEPEFWQEVLACTGKGVPPRSEAFYLGADFVRGTLEGWSFAQIESADPFVAMDKLLFPAASASEARLDHLACELAGVEGSDRKAAVAQASSDRIALGIMPAPLIVGQSWQWRRDVPGAAMALVQGFHPIEYDGVWSDGKVGEIAFQLGGQPEDTFRLSGEVAFSFFRGTAPASPALLLRVNGRACAAWLHRPEDEPYHRLPFAADVPAGQPCRLQLEVSHAASPAELGMGEDKRVLGYILHEVQVTAQSPDCTGDQPGFLLWGGSDRPVGIATSDER